MKILISAFLVFVVFACFGAGRKKEETKLTSVPNVPTGYVIIAPDAKTIKQNTGCGTILMLWGVFTIFLFILIFS